VRGAFVFFNVIIVNVPGVWPLEQPAPSRVSADDEGAVGYKQERG
jgi:hypothetical protein